VFPSVQDEEGSPIEVRYAHVGPTEALLVPRNEILKSTAERGEMNENYPIRCEQYPEHCLITVSHSTTPGDTVLRRNTVALDSFLLFICRGSGSSRRTQPLRSLRLAMAAVDRPLLSHPEIFEFQDVIKI